MKIVRSELPVIPNYPKGHTFEAGTMHLKEGSVRVELPYITDMNTRTTYVSTHYGNSDDAQRAAERAAQLTGGSVYAVSLIDSDIFGNIEGTPHIQRMNRDRHKEPQSYKSMFISAFLVGGLILWAITTILDAIFKAHGDY
jgi:hypothetical protein